MWDKILMNNAENKYIRQILMYQFHVVKFLDILVQLSYVFFVCVT